MNAALLCCACLLQVLLLLSDTSAETVHCQHFGRKSQQRTSALMKASHQGLVGKSRPC